MGRRGQNTVEYLMMVSVVVGVVLVGGSALKRFMPSLFSNVQDMIAGAASGDSSGGESVADGGTTGSSSGHQSGAQRKDPGNEGEVASVGADGATSASSEHTDGHPKAHSGPLHH